MALDESKETDETFEIDGYTYVVDKDFLEQAKPIKIDFLEIGFKLTSSLVFDQGGQGCAGSCSTGGEAGSCGS